MLVQLRLLALSATAQTQVAYQEQIAVYEQVVKDQAFKKEELKLQAERDQKTYDALNIHDDQFDLSDALIAIAGLAAWGIHPDAFIKLLS